MSSDFYRELSKLNVDDLIKILEDYISVDVRIQAIFHKHKEKYLEVNGCLYDGE